LEAEVPVNRERLPTVSAEGAFEKKNESMFLQLHLHYCLPEKEFVLAKVSLRP
jgi:hypothetical protein